MLNTYLLQKTLAETLARQKMQKKTIGANVPTGNAPVVAQDAPRIDAMGLAGQNTGSASASIVGHSGGLGGHVVGRADEYSPREAGKILKCHPKYLVKICAKQKIGRQLGGRRSPWVLTLADIERIRVYRESAVNEKAAALRERIAANRDSHTGRAGDGGLTWSEAKQWCGIGQKKYESIVASYRRGTSVESIAAAHRMRPETVLTVLAVDHMMRDEDMLDACADIAFIVGGVFGDAFREAIVDEIGEEKYTHFASIRKEVFKRFKVKVKDRLSKWPLVRDGTAKRCPRCRGRVDERETWCRVCECRDRAKGKKC